MNPEKYGQYSDECHLSLQSGVKLRYDANNRMTNMVDGLGTSSYAYDAVGQLSYEDGPWAYDTVSYSYTNRFRTGLGIAAPDASASSQSYAYDTVKRLKNVTSLGGPHGYSYTTNRQARITTLVYPNGSSVTNAWESVAELSNTVLHNSVGTTFNSHAYLYDDAGQRTRQTRLGGNYVTNRYDIEGELIFANSTVLRFDLQPGQLSGNPCLHIKLEIPGIIPKLYTHSGQPIRTRS